MILLTKLVLAHLAGDFLLQPGSWVRDKELRRYKSPKLYLHVIVHGVLTFLLLWDLDAWLPALIIAIAHLLIDMTKATYQKPGNKLPWFIGDQLLHLAVIFGIWSALAKPDLSVDSWPLADLLIIATAVVFLTSPSSAIIRTVISHWTPDTLATVNESLPDAGKFIGFLERLMVLVFILFNHWEAVGFLLAAKSVFRFGDLRESHDRKLTEYVLIGTLLSFGIAILAALVTSACLTLVP